MHYAGQSLAGKACEQAPHLPLGHAEQLSGLASSELSGGGSGQDVGPPLLCFVQDECPHTTQYADIFPEQLTRTYSLSSDKATNR